jgi:chlorite dismutase
MTQTTTEHPSGEAAAEPAARPARGRPQVEPPDLREKGSPKDGQPQTSDHRLFLQLLAFTGCRDSAVLGGTLQQAGVTGVVYEDLNDPRGVAILTMSDDPAFFIETLRPVLNQEPFASLTPKPEYTMFGRTYAIGYETDLEETLITRPRSTALNPAWPWAVWYPIRRSGEFERLDPTEQRAILGEHGVIGMSFGQGDYAHDIRLACHGLDKNDSDFVVGLFGKELYPLSAIVQRMRGTKQTALYLERLGPFFIGKAVWQAGA